jgi:hypothetical protein
MNRERSLENLQVGMRLTLRKTKLHHNGLASTVLQLIIQQQDWSGFNSGGKSYCSSCKQEAENDTQTVV